MDTNLIKAFVALAEENNFSRAAARLHLSQPAVSQRVKRLEREVGTQLFERTSSGAVLTSSGRRLLDKGRRILGDVDDFTAIAGNSEPHLRGHLRVAYSGYHVTRYLPGLLRRLHAAHPGITVALSSDLHGGLAPKAVLDGAVDFAFSRSIHHGDHVGYHVYALDDAAIAVPADHPLATRTAVSIEEVMDEPFITYPFLPDGMVRNMVGAMAQNSGGAFPLRYEVADTPMILALVAAGLGITQTFTSVVPSPIEGVRLVKLTGIATFENTIIWNESRSADPAHAAFIEIIKEALPPIRNLE
jgi:DNA-binding transcriptional LysR family regulator